MTIKECIDIADAVKPNQYSTEEKVRWLSQLDMRIFQNIICTHHRLPDEPEITFEQYSSDNLSYALLEIPPHDELYVAFLKMKIDEENGESTRYNNSASMFNTLYEEFEKKYNKTHMPKGCMMKIF